MSAYKPFPLFRGEITYEEACDRECNVLRELSYREKTVDFLQDLFSHSEEIGQTVSLHLGLQQNQSCQLGDFREWLHGTYNVCIPIYINNWDRRRIYPGTVDEKVRSEVATYIWVRQNCPDVPIPHL
jgi:hypothetical protein